MASRVAGVGDLWGGMRKSKRSLRRAIEQVRKMRSGGSGE
jgi:hypothetical protein